MSCRATTAALTPVTCWRWASVSGTRHSQRSRLDYTGSTLLGRLHFAEPIRSSTQWPATTVRVNSTRPRTAQIPMEWICIICCVALSGTLALTFYTTRGHMTAVWYDQTFVKVFGTRRQHLGRRKWPMLTWNLRGSMWRPYHLTSNNVNCEQGRVSLPLKYEITYLYCTLRNGPLVCRTACLIR